MIQEEWGPVLSRITSTDSNRASLVRLSFSPMLSAETNSPFHRFLHLAWKRLLERLGYLSTTAIPTVVEAYDIGTQPER